MSSSGRVHGTEPVPPLPSCHSERSRGMERYSSEEILRDVSLRAGLAYSLGHCCRGRCLSGSGNCAEDSENIREQHTLQSRIHAAGRAIDLNRPPGRFSEPPYLFVQSNGSMEIV